jgi:hypothetical protein
LALFSSTSRKTCVIAATLQLLFSCLLERKGLEAISAEADDRLSATSEACDEAAIAVYGTIPQTREGMLALISVLREHNEGSLYGEDDIKLALDTITAALKGGLNG